MPCPLLSVITVAPAGSFICQPATSVAAAASAGDAVTSRVAPVTTAAPRTASILLFRRMTNLPPHAAREVRARFALRRKLAARPYRCRPKGEIGGQRATEIRRSATEGEK